jgi:polysaccharide biosynthesis/export protein
MKSNLPTFLLLCAIIPVAQTAATAQAVLTTPDASVGQNAPTPNQRSWPQPSRSPATNGPIVQPDTGNPFSAAPQPSTRSVGPLTTQSDFQRFAEDIAGRPLPVYGRAAFDQVPNTFAPADLIPVPNDYVIGPGDEIIIRIWGKIDLDGRFTVDRNGQISLPKVGTLDIAGLHYDQLQSRIRSAVSALYRDFELNVTLGRLRSIQIYVIGSARQPGVYTVSSLSTLVNALFASGGPSATGSMRRIQLRRADQTIAEFDLYQLLRNGDKSHDRQLLPGDVIFIPPVGPQVAVFGSVNEPGVYELKNDTSVNSLLHDAGGLTPLAEVDKVLIERVQDHRTRSVDQFALDSTGLQRPVSDGDVLRILPVSPQFENSVTLRGNVAQPGRYPWHEGMRVSDLIPNREALISRDYWNQLNHTLPAEAENPFAVPVTSRYREQAAAGAQSEYQFRSGETSSQARQGVPGQVPTRQTPYPQQNQNDKQSTSESASYQAFGSSISGETPTIATIGKISAEINWEYAVIERLDERDLSTHLIPFRLATALDDHASADNQLLRPGDVLTIFSRADLELPVEKHAIFVRVGGEVNAPGVYRVEPGDTLQDVVRRSGGLTSHAYLYASRFTRVSTRRAQEEQMRRSSEQMQKELLARYATTTPAPGQTATDQQAQLSLQQAALLSFTLTRPTGRIVLQLKPTASTVDDIPPMPLEDGDAFYVPPRLSTVQVTGSVYNPNAFRYQEGKILKSYLNSAGGPTREADKGRVFVIRADGTVISKQSSRSHSPSKFDNLKLLPGDAIVVPEKIKTPGANKLLQVTQGVSQAALTAAALSTVIP